MSFLPVLPMTFAWLRQFDQPEPTVIWTTDERSRACGKEKKNEEIVTPLTDEEKQLNLATFSWVASGRMRTAFGSGCIESQ
jgi:hypothetical protein